MAPETAILIDQQVPARPTEHADVQRAAAGDTTAFERLYQSHSARIHALCRRMAGADDADDLTQEVFVRAWRKLDRFRGEAAFGTWLYRLAVNVILARRATLGSYRARFAAEDAAPADATPSRRRSLDVRMDMERAIQKLPDGARRVFVLHDVEGYTHEEIAEMLSVSAGTSKSQLHRARMSLRQYLT